MADFERDTAVQAAGDGAFSCEIRDDWWVAMGPNGGYLAAILVRALSAGRELAGRPLRSLTVHYLRAPAAGPARVVVEADRHGQTVSFLRARLEQDGKICASAQAVFADDRGGLELERAGPPSGLSEPEALPEPSRPPRPPASSPPPFARQFHYRPQFGSPPFSAGTEAVSGGWLKLRHERPLDEALVVALCDAWIPAVFSITSGPLAVPTLELTVHLRAALPLPSDWVLARFTTGLARHGFLEEDGAIWSRDGVLLAQSRQLALAG